MSKENLVSNQQYQISCVHLNELLEACVRNGIPTNGVKEAGMILIQGALGIEPPVRDNPPQSQNLGKLES